MVEPTTDAIPADELRLAQLACAKMAGMVQGTISVGLPALASAAPEPRAFLDEQFRVMNGFALVLHAVSGRPGGQQEILRLRERSREVLVALENLRRQVLERLDPPPDPAATFRPARDAALGLCGAIGGYAHLVGLDSTRIANVRGVVIQVFDGVESMTPVGGSSVP